MDGDGWVVSWLAGWDWVGLCVANVGSWGLGSEEDSLMT